MRLSPVFSGLDAYPFLRLNDAKRRLTARGVDLIDFGVGEPREETPAFIRETLAAAISPRAGYPLAEGLPEYRASVSAWIHRRFGASVDPATQVIPTLGSKEAIFHLAQLLAGDHVVVTSPGYPVAARGALFAGKGVVELPLVAEHGFLPDLDAVPEAVWARTAILWLNYPNNPTAATAPPELYARAAALARRHDFVLASDEAYSELYFGDDVPGSALQCGDLANVAVFNTLSKRSSMPGLRCGFVAGDAQLISALKAYRPNVGVAPQEHVQRAGIAAWGDEDHVRATREIYRAKRDVLLPVLMDAGFEPVGGDATFFVWLRAPDGALEALLEAGVVLAPGEIFGPVGRGYARLALVPTLEQCHAAAARIVATL
ncbi:MAG: N-succinyl-L,L-diaminopimelate aminotransferase alternative [uncultured Solirubrobacteraceae bacterium]|uniref:N-succinyl-L,L-diaminopimelate aminotransferase alternative n=1 Tax=uncultured Solirubrobacteraceae bacterium TaxID=1162706 RepID=A0A6J4SAZ4_9ACTN|nr:MAG: N-succinyl-L,L-diaminopimelate aminotransferase alternative [uncultured Solirubrobacteraceae bacterium]